MVERLLTPSKITAWLECGHFLSLRNQVDAGSLSIAPAARGSLADLLVEKGAQHERDCLADLENQGKSVYHVPGRNPGESFDAWVTRIGNPLQGNYDVIFQMPFVHEGIRGIADFLVRVDEPDEHFALYEPIDAKLARAEAKPGHVLQLCFYADAIAALSGRAPRSIHLWLGTGVQETLVVEQFGPYWRRLRQQLRVLLEKEVDFDTVPVPCDHCEYCEFSDRCQNEWRRQDALVYVANIRANQQEALEDAGVRTVVELSRRSEPVASLHEENLSRLVRQASLQVASRERPENTRLSSRLLNRAMTRSTVTALNSFPHLTTATSSLTLKGTRSGPRNRTSSSLRDSTYATTLARGITNNVGPIQSKNRVG
jgi:predicted RecB family nuclease